MDDPGQNSKSFEVRGNWFRWSQLDLFNGSLVPAPNAKFEQYDPWNEFRKNSGKYRTVRQPYVEFLELGRKLLKAAETGISASPLRDSRYPLAEEPLRGPQNLADQLIIDWSNHHGSLGIVPVLANSIRLPPRIEPGEDYELSIEKLQYFRHGGSWHWGIEKRSVLGHSTEAVEEKSRSFTADCFKVSWFNWSGHFYTEQPLSSIRHFFGPFGLPDKQEEFAPPAPMTKEFWLLYAEPVREVALWCLQLKKAFDLISLFDNSQPSEADRVQTAYWQLSALAQCAAPTFRFNPKRNSVDEERVSAGLLASYALMFLWDRAEGRRALQCQTCEQYFVSDVERAAYCSPRCRDTAQKRRTRAKSIKTMTGDDRA